MQTRFPINTMLRRTQRTNKICSKAMTKRATSMIQKSRLCRYETSLGQLTCYLPMAVPSRKKIHITCK